MQTSRFGCNSWILREILRFGPFALGVIIPLLILLSMFVHGDDVWINGLKKDLIQLVATRSWYSSTDSACTIKSPAHWSLTQVSTDDARAVRARIEAHTAKTEAGLFVGFTKHDNEFSAVLVTIRKDGLGIWSASFSKGAHRVHQMKSRRRIAHKSLPEHAGVLLIRSEADRIKVELDGQPFMEERIDRVGGGFGLVVRGEATFFDVAYLQR